MTRYDGNAERYTLIASIQHPFVARKVLAGTIFFCDEINVRVVTGDVGGSFGIKASIYPEEATNCIAASRGLGW